MFIRPPARWINSAWWQWGAWDSKKQNFDNWLVSAIKKTNWHKYILMLLNYKNINKFSIYPLSSDVIEQLHRYLKLNSNIKKISETNNSLPKEALKFFLDNRSYRPSAHQNKNDSKISELIEKRNYKFNPPWVLNQSHLKLIMDNTYKSNKELLNFLDKRSQELIINDPEWWDSNSFKEKETFTPFLENYCPDINHKKFIETILFKILEEY